MSFRLLPLLLLPVIAACAKGPDAIVPVGMGPAFQATSCRDAAQMLTQERSQLASLSETQRGAQMGDAFGVFLLGVPVSSLSGGDKEGATATSKGKVIALESRLAGCYRARAAAMAGRIASFMTSTVIGPA